MMARLNDPTLAIIDAVYIHAPAGGSLHAMLEDDNLEDYWFENGYQPMDGISPEQIEIERRAWDLLNGLTYDRRIELLARYRAALNEIGEWPWL